MREIIQEEEKDVYMADFINENNNKKVEMKQKDNCEVQEFVNGKILQRLYQIGETKKMKRNQSENVSFVN